MLDREPSDCALTLLSRRDLTRRLAITCSAAVALSRSAKARTRLPPVFYSSDGQYIQLQPKSMAPVAPIKTAGGSTIDFPHYRGKVVLVNFWATWCVPCVYEMPSLNRLVGSVDPKLVQVLPVSVDDGGQESIHAFYRRLGLDHLKIFVDPDQQVGYFDARNVNHGAFPLYALPITYAIDPMGNIDGYISGAAHWNSPHARALIEYLAQQAGA